MEQEGYDFSGEYGKLYYNIAFNQAFNQIVGPMALRDMTTSSGYTVPETEINRSLIEQYYSEAGEYSISAFMPHPTPPLMASSVVVPNFSGHIPTSSSKGKRPV